ncbi:dihydrofolate reductase [Nocardioides anomalus]|uniref:Dihydrofolate reductase n=1 Tax=Nocardioides anomalus TaxID=2712223 RepID=A0A6G6WEG2_9ACTN|nr:dihydrofolate reductase [Nocardioides anomalus]QIG43596.1 dihydrofolate reductase [Nocardioides anomalus]
MTKRVVLVAAVARNGVIGRGSQIPWKLPGEQRLFKELTMGDVLVMGRATYESIGRPLPGRTTIVLTRDPDWGAEGVRVAHSLDDALVQAATLPGDIAVVGGAEVYAAAMPLATEQVLSEVDLEPEGDVFYPPFDRRAWVEAAREHHEGYDRVFLVRA